MNMAIQLFKSILEISLFYVRNDFGCASDKSDS